MFISCMFVVVVVVEGYGGADVGEDDEDDEWCETWGDHPRSTRMMLLLLLVAVKSGARLLSSLNFYLQNDQILIRDRKWEGY